MGSTKNSIYLCYVKGHRIDWLILTYLRRLKKGAYIHVFKGKKAEISVKKTPAFNVLLLNQSLFLANKMENALWIYNKAN